MASVNDRNIYLEKKSLNEARAIVTETFATDSEPASETIAVPDAVGRVLAAGVCARLSVPPYHVAAMDGIAVAAEETYGAGESTPLILESGRNAFFVNTGNPLPAGTNAVIMIEDVHVIDDRRIEIMAPVVPWRYVRKAGEDIVATELIFPARHQITPLCVGALLSAGVFAVPVVRRPTVLIIPTGDELVDCHPDMDPAGLPPGKILETNSTMLGKLIEANGGQYIRHAIVPDNAEQIRQAVENALDSGRFQMVLLVGGSSAGASDYSRSVISSLGKVLVHGVTIMPGKPLIIGVVRGTPVWGMPGYPVSAVICFDQLVRPLLRFMQRLPQQEKPALAATLAKKAASRLGVEEFLRVRLGNVGGRVVATQLPRGAGSVSSLAEADALVRIPADTEGLSEGALVQAELIRTRPDLDNTIVIVGSHDNTLNVLADLAGRSTRKTVLASSHVGSLGGLIALSKGYCHLAGSHLLDTETGEYNISYIKKYLKGMKIKLVRLVDRDQGLMVAKGNPLGIKDFADLAGEKVRFINRQAGSGTRVLLDYRLKQLGLDPTGIKGYENEEYTHMSVAIAVASGAADAGLGILAAARALGLDFIPVVTEQYELVIPEKFFALPAMQSVMEIISSREFAQRVTALGGYSTAETGKTVEIS
jgi:putative molybdopterin biosynthesis protein